MEAGGRHRCGRMRKPLPQTSPSIFRRCPNVCTGTAQGPPANDSNHPPARDLVPTFPFISNEQFHKSPPPLILAVATQNHSPGGIQRHPPFHTQPPPPQTQPPGSPPNPPSINNSRSHKGQCIGHCAPPGPPPRSVGRCGAARTPPNQTLPQAPTQRNAQVGLRTTLWCRGLADKRVASAAAVARLQAPPSSSHFGGRTPPPVFCFWNTHIIRRRRSCGTSPTPSMPP